MKNREVVISDAKQIKKYMAKPTIKLDEVKKYSILLPKDMRKDKALIVLKTFIADLMQNAQGVPKEQFILDLIKVLEVSRLSGLNPFMNELFPIYKADNKNLRTEIIGVVKKRKKRTQEIYTETQVIKVPQKKLILITAVAAMWRIAAETGTLAGRDATKIKYAKSGLPHSATTTIYKIVQGHRVPFTFTAMFKEYVRNTPIWQKMPVRMLTKCSEGGCLRQSHGERLSAVYTSEEFGAKDKQSLQSIDLDKNN